MMDMEAFRSNAILTTAQCYEADALALKAGVKGITLMERAGTAIADAVSARYAPCSVSVLCGPGNNGGDGFCAARHLLARGYDVRVFLLGDVASLKGDAAEMAALYKGVLLPLGESALENSDIVIDALFGAGLSRPLEGGVATLALKAHNEDRSVICVDVPSGVPGDGTPPQGPTFKADATVTFFRFKPAHLLMPARDLCGERVLVDIGTPLHALNDLRPKIARNLPSLWKHAWPQIHSRTHKFARGHVLVIGGGVADGPGASRLAAQAALRLGAGLVSLAAPADVLALNTGALTSVMTRVLDNAPDLKELMADKRLNSVVIGPGCGVSDLTRAQSEIALRAGANVVLDADALSVWADKPEDLFALLGKSRAVLTPHEGEFARLFPDLAADICASSKISRVRDAAMRAQAVVLLKGPDTVIAAPDGHIVVNDSAPPYLATAGAGDVLAGFIGSLLAQGMGTFEAAAAGVWVHGQAARHIGAGLIAEDLQSAVPSIMQCVNLG